jgi:hypothetical protein
MLKKIKFDFKKFKKIVYVDFRLNWCINNAANRVEEPFALRELQEEITANCTGMEKIEYF